MRRLILAALAAIILTGCTYNTYPRQCKSEITFIYPFGWITHDECTGEIKEGVSDVAQQLFLLNMQMQSTTN